MPSTELIKFIGVVIIRMTALQTAEAYRGARIVSPEVKSDRMVTFRFHAPRAHQVLVAAENLGGLRPLRLGEDCI